MAREGSVVPAMSDDARRLQLQRDRLRTKAISLFLADHRESLLCKLKKAGSRNYNSKRKALEHVARKNFSEEKDSVRRHYMNLAGATGEGKKEGSGGSGEKRLRGRLVDCAGFLREIYGDAGGFETLAGGLRILDKVSVATCKGDDTAKAAAILGLAGKLTQTPENKNHVRTLWAKIAGKRRERLVRDLEQKVFMAWSRDSLESDYVPKVVQ